MCNFCYPFFTELFHTERSHVRNLKVLDLVFRRPLAESGILSTESMGLIFANLDEMLETHSGFNNSFKIKRKENPVVGEIGDLLLSMVSIDVLYSSACGLLSITLKFV